MITTMSLTAIKTKKYKKLKKKMNLILIQNQTSVLQVVKVKKIINEKLIIHILFNFYNELELLNMLFTLINWYCSNLFIQLNNFRC